MSKTARTPALDDALEKIRREATAVVERYARRDLIQAAALYSPLDFSVCLSVQERERALIRLLARRASRPVGSLSVLEVGCGTGRNLAELIKLGFAAERLTGIDLLEERILFARRQLPPGVTLILGDALTETLPLVHYDVVYASTVFSSILDGEIQELLAQRMWSLLKPGGFVLWYDFTFDNPKNQDVRGVSVGRFRALFPEGTSRYERVTLAPPISRRVTRLLPGLYAVFNSLPFLRTHILGEIMKPADGDE